MTLLHALLLTDGNPGHEKQSRAILRALNRYVDLETEQCAVEAVQPRFRADIAIGTGRTTHYPLVKVKMRCGARIITCMSPHVIFRYLFDLCCVPLHDSITGKNIFTTMGPPNLSSPSSQHNNKAGLIVVGGADDTSHYWNDVEILDTLSEILNKSDISCWTVAGSPRTPAQTEDKIIRLLGSHRHASYYSFNQTPPGWIEEQYQRNATVWVTADSINMIYEALTAGCKVGVIPVRWKKRRKKFAINERYLVECDMILTFDQWRLGDELPELSAPLNEADRCAREIVRRWWPENLP